MNLRNLLYGLVFLLPLTFHGLSAAAQSTAPALPTISTEGAPLPVVISPTARWIHYDGRFDKTNPSGPRCSWPASTVKLKFRGSALNVKLNESDNNDEYEVVIDRQPTAVLISQAGPHIYRLYNGAKNGIHTLSLVKRTEAFFGISQFQGFQLSRGGQLLHLPKPTGRRIEVVGDSISCGYGDEALNQTQHFSSTTENAYLSYGDVAARALEAQYVCAAWSGRLMWPTDTMNAIYGMTLPTVPGSHWDFAQWIPQAVIISLGTNDFAGSIPDAKAWTDGYEAFIKRVRSHYPHAWIYVASSPMLWGPKNTVERADLHQIVSDENLAGDTKVHFLNIPTQDGSKNGFGADWHPSVKTQALMAQVVEAALEKDLGWQPIAHS